MLGVVCLWVELWIVVVVVGFDFVLLIVDLVGWGYFVFDVGSLLLRMFVNFEFGCLMLNVGLSW